MKKSFARFISFALLTVLIISLTISGCGKKSDSPNSPVTPPVQDGQNDSNHSENNTAPNGQPVTPPGTTVEGAGFVKDGKVYITDCIFIGQEGKINGSGWTSWQSKCRQAAKELINYKSSNDITEKNIEGALSDAFRPVITSPNNESGGHQIENLKNGDIVTWTYEIDESRFEKLKSYVKGIEFVVTDGELVIAGLVETVEINPFEDPSIFGIDYYDDENGERVWSFSITDLCSNSGVPLEVETDNMGHTGQWKNGDQFKVKILTSAEQLKEYGYVFTQTEGIITIWWLG